MPFFFFSIICSLTIKSGAWIWHLDAILALGGGNFKERIFKGSNARDIAQEGPGCLNFKLIDAYNFKEFSQSEGCSGSACLRTIRLIVL